MLLAALVGRPGHYEESNRSDIHEGGSLPPHPLNVELETASAEKWDTTGTPQNRGLNGGPKLKSPETLHALRWTGARTTPFNVSTKS
jgi:hypothetical protein